MLYGPRLDEALDHVEGSRYALVHAVAKRARQITLWLTADPAELRAEDAPPPAAAGELVSRDPVTLSEEEILHGEVRVRWDPDGLADERELTEAAVIETDPLLIEGLTSEDEDEELLEVEESGPGVTPALAQALDADAPASPPETPDVDLGGPGLDVDEPELGTGELLDENEGLDEAPEGGEVLDEAEDEEATDEEA